jgi:hypothetical protein
MNYSNWTINLYPISVWYQFYFLPTVKVTYDKRLFGFYNIEFIWGKWGVEITFSKEG